MRDRRVVFTGPDRVVLDEFDFDTGGLAPDQCAIESLYSIVSAGTELASLTGLEARRYPVYPGYGGCGRVTAVGDAVTGIAPGDTVVSYTQHASRVLSGTLIAKVPTGLDPQLAPAARMAAVGMTALRISNGEPGDRVAVIGLGLVGNLCAQLFTLAGCDVIGIDLSARRTALAEACGVRDVIHAGDADVRAAVADITGGHMCEVVVEAIGSPAATEQAAGLAAKAGEVVLLGSPRAAHQTDITPLLRSIHMWGDGCITFRGAHEWRYPTRHSPSGHAKHSIERNVRILLEWMADGRLRVRELVTHVARPEECAAAYAGLRDHKDDYLGVVFDWAGGS
ncbi:alcohol dehydrogenase [Candidatus Poribacteria bacterium]|nr:alcohol dehydrogenase [Candidatus Poribacteria bacterium]